MDELGFYFLQQYFSHFETIKTGLGKIFSCMLPGPQGFAIIGTHVLLKKGQIRLFFMVVHMQTKDDNWNFSSAKFETFENLVCAKATHPDHF